MKYFIGQALGILVTFGAILTLQMKNKKQMLLVSAVVNILASLNILLIDSFTSGVIINLVAVIQIILSLWHERTNTQPGLYEKIVFLFLYVAGGALGFKKLIDILSIVAAVFYMFAMFQKKEQRIRLFLMGNMLSWTVYHAVLRSTAIFAQLAGIISSLVALYRYRSGNDSASKIKATAVLPEDYCEVLSVDLQKDKKKAILVNGIALIIGAVMVVPMHFYIPVTSLFMTEGDIKGLLLRSSVLLGGLVLYMILHEAVHGITMKLYGTKKVKYGFTGLYAFAGSNDYYGKSSYITIALAPVIVWGIALALINIFVPREWFWTVYMIQVANISGAAGDLYVTLRFLSLPKDILVRDYGVGMKVYSAQK